MRFLILTQYFPPEIGAPQVRLASMVRELARRGHEVEVVTAMPNHPTGRIQRAYRNRYYIREEYGGVPVRRVWLYPSMGRGIKRMLNYGSFAVTSLLGLACSRRPDHVFVESPPLFLGVSGWLAAKRWGVPLIYNVADLWVDAIRDMGIMNDGAMLRFAGWLEQWCYRHSLYVNAVTDGVARVLADKKHVPREKLLFLPNGVDTDLFRPLPPDEAWASRLNVHLRKVFLYAGTHGYAHAVETALHAARILADEPVQFVFVGDGSEKPKLVQLARKMVLRNVTFLDPAPPETVARLYSVSYAGLSTLRNARLFEGARPVKVFAAMACGKPVVYGGKGEGAQLVERAGCGLTVAPEDPVAMADAVRTLAAQPQEAEELGRKGRCYVKAHFSWCAIIGDWLRQTGGSGLPPGTGHGAFCSTAEDGRPGCGRVRPYVGISRLLARANPAHKCHARPGCLR